jgi:hypothetical protein
MPSVLIFWQSEFGEFRALHSFFLFFSRKQLPIPAFHENSEPGNQGSSHRFSQCDRN